MAQFTWTAGVSLIQPITPLFAIYDQYKIQELGVDVATIKRRAVRREVAFATIQAYYRLLEARRLVLVIMVGPFVCLVILSRRTAS